MSGKPPPIPDTITDAYWRRLGEGFLAAPQCAGCDRMWLPPSPACPHCWSTSHELVDCSGKGRLVTWTVYHRSYHPAFAESVPYAVGLVELDEGPRLFAGIDTQDPATLTSGMPLVLFLEEREGGFRVPVFRPGKAMEK